MRPALHGPSVKTFLRQARLVHYISIYSQRHVMKDIIKDTASQTLSTASQVVGSITHAIGFTLGLPGLIAKKKIRPLQGGTRLVARNRINGRHQSAAGTRRDPRPLRRLRPGKD
jgi:hypothetical protein